MKDEIIQHYRRLLESPDAEKCYIDLKKHYDSMEMSPESIGLSHLLKERFNVVVDLPADKKQ